jgi:flagellar protein FlgJ
MSITNQTDFFLNFQQFSDLKVQARDKSDAAATAVAQQFEGLFVQQMLAAMRAATKINSPQDSSYMDFYQEMYDKQLAQSIAGQERLGVASLILRHMPGNAAGADETVVPLDPTAGLEFERPSAKPVAMEADVATSASAAPVVTTPISAAVASRVVADDFAEVTRNEHINSRWQSPHNFVADILPLAQSAAKILGVSAKLLVAQSALETGWGKHTMKFADGRSSNNLFGIKAGPDWQGDLLHKTSLEYQDGVMQQQVSSFRAYATPAQSLADYVDTIQANPRYQQALQQVGNDQAYIREIQQAGYATDPRYADKVIGILNGETLQRTLASLNPGVSDHV